MTYLYTAIVSLMLTTTAFAATFDADLIPGATNSYDIGLSTARWKNLFLSGNLAIGNTLTLGNLSVEPSGMNGMLYYNTALNTFRGFRNGAWADLGYWNLSGNDISLNVSGNVGIGTTGAPTEKLTVQGNILSSGSLSSASLAVSGAGTIGGDLTVTGTAQLGGFKMASGAVQGKVLTSDADGVGTWQTPTGGTGIPPGYSILGDTTASPVGYTYTGTAVETIEKWTTKTSMPTARENPAAAAVNNKIYVIGGRATSLDVLPTNEEYDPATNTWATKRNMPTAREFLAAAAVNNKIYVIGGARLTPSIYIATNEEYNPATNTWVTKTSMPTARNGLAAVPVNDKIYAIGGRSSAGYLATNEEYNPATNSWATKANMPTARGYLSATLVSGKIYAIGGWNGNSLATNEEYDPATNVWITKTSMLTPRDTLIAATANDKIYAIGGYYNGYLATNEEYNPATDAWVTKLRMTTPRHRLAGATVNNKIYVIGGYSPGGRLATNEEYDPLLTTFYYVHKKD